MAGENWTRSWLSQACAYMSTNVTSRRVRAARLADEQNLKRGRRRSIRIAAIKYVWTVNGPEPWLPAVAAGLRTLSYRRLQARGGREFFLR